MAVKRRVIWMSDEDWGRLRARAEANDLTISAYLRLAKREQPADVEQRVTNILDEIDRAQHLGPRSFPEFRPAPKPGRK